jgi:NAD(P)-dependent dehydrogenase (short-subunit alcohol dehydrogenase family)
MSVIGRGRVVVTGASTGIGEATAQHLRELGFDVLAGVRKAEDAERLRTVGVTPLMLDVTDAAQIEAARAEVGDGPLAGLVNNAGVGYGGPVEFLAIEDLRQQLEVNVIGQVAVTQAFMGPLRAGGGRIVNISSIGGRVALPLVGPYNASKFALEGLSDSLRRELLRQGVDVIVIEPGGVKTPIWSKSDDTFERIMEDAPPELQQRYGTLVAGVRGAMQDIANRTGVEPREVAETIGKALTADKPRTRYLVGKDAKQRGPLAKLMPDRVMDRLIARTLKY